MRMAKRGTDHSWEFVKYTGDLCYYARCRCGFEYACCKQEDFTIPKWEPAPEKLYRYCPICGARKIRYKDDVKYIDTFRWGIVPDFNEEAGDEESIEGTD